MVNQLLEPGEEAEINRLDGDTEPIDSLLEGDKSPHNEAMVENAAKAEKILGVDLTKYIDSMQVGKRPDNIIGTTASKDGEVDLGDFISREGDTDIVYDPDFFYLNEAQQLGGTIHEIAHAAYYNDDLDRLMRDIGFSAEETYHLINIAETSEEWNEAVTEYFARMMNPERDKIIYDGDEQRPVSEAYEGEVGDLAKYLAETGLLPDDSRTHALKTDEDFYGETDIGYVDVGSDHYVEEGTYLDEEGEQHDYVLLLGEGEEIEKKREEAENRKGVEIWEEDLLEYLKEGRWRESNEGEEFDPIGFEDKYGPDDDDDYDNHYFPEDSEFYHENTLGSDDYGSPVIGMNWDEIAPISGAEG